MSAALFRHCSRCGCGGMTAIGSREVVCDACGYRHFLTPIPAACALVLDRHDRLLIARRAHEPGLGKWGIPGGVIEPWESAEAAASRELLEEVGVELPSAAFTYLVSLNNRYLFQDFVWPTLDLCFVARVDGDVEVHPDPAEVLETRWCPLHAVPLDDFAFQSSIDAVRLLTERAARDKPSRL
ncbi:MAG TPA: NUDIX domain-containing protein [Prosthecobacter sp.]|nr:NUDIX domain-containing protein [Prosthecobacter sp.]